MFRANPQRTGVYNTIGVSQLRGVKWKLQKNPLANLISPSSPIVVADGVLYFSSQNGHLYAVDAQTGQELWKFQIEAEVLSNLVFHNQVIYISGLERYICALDIQTKQQKWQTQIGTSRNSDPVIFDGILYVANSDGHLYAVEQETGQLLWTFKTTKDMPTTPPSLANGVVYVGSKDGNLYAVDAKTGQPKWKFEIGPLGSYSVPVIFDGAIYIGADKIGADKNTYLFAVDAETGQEVWQMKIEKLLSPLLSLAITNGVAYVGTFSGFYAIALQTRQVLWQKFGPKRYIFISNLVVADADGIIYGGCTGAIHALDGRTGQELWNFIAPEPEQWILQPKLWGFQLMNFGKKIVTGSPFTLFSPPVIADGIIYVGCGNGYLYALH